MIPCFDKDGMTRMVAWYAAERIIAQFSAPAPVGMEGVDMHSPIEVARATACKSTAEAITKIAARVNARKS